MSDLLKHESFDDMAVGGPDKVLGAEASAVDLTAEDAAMDDEIGKDDEEDGGDEADGSTSTSPKFERKVTRRGLGFTPKEDLLVSKLDGGLFESMHLASFWSPSHWLTTSLFCTLGRFRCAKAGFSQRRCFRPQNENPSWKRC